jgi:predicted transcriptional regulator of viral defense system
MRLGLSALRETEQPMSARQVAEHAMRAKGLPTDNEAIVGSVRVQVRVALGRLEDRGLLVRIISAPDAWWTLAG